MRNGISAIFGREPTANVVATVGELLVRDNSGSAGRTGSEWISDCQKV